MNDAKGKSDPKIFSQMVVGLMVMNPMGSNPYKITNPSWTGHPKKHSY